MKKEIISTRNIKAFSGAPYSPAIKIGDFVFISGQIPDNPDADIEKQTRQVLEKIRALVEAAGTSLANVVKCTVYLSSLTDFASMNDVYREFFPKEPPARAAVEVSGLFKDYKVEIEAIAYAC